MLVLILLSLRDFNFTWDDDDDDEEYYIPLEDMPKISLSIALAPVESEDAFGSDSESVLPSSDDFSPIFEEKSVTFSNPLFDSNNDFTSSDDESLFDEDVSEDDIECEDSYDSNLDESTFLVTPLSDSNEDECLAPRDAIEAFSSP
ncbi:hypothetical protein Tco_0512197 [Tanacetum coccineum]